MAVRIENSGPDNDNPVVDMRNVSKSFGDDVILDNVDMNVYRGETLVVLGASGSGKSVMMGCIVGLLKPDSGTVYVFGREVTAFNRERDWNSVRLRIGYLFQGGALFDSMSVGENVAFPARNHSDMTKKEIAARVRKNLDLVGLGDTEQKMPSELSGGMQKRAALARALTLEPELIIYDEPTTGLDPIRSDSISRLIRRLQKELHTTALVVTHDMACADTVADRVVLLHEGVFIAEGTMDEIRDDPDPRVNSFIAGQTPSPGETSS